MGLQTHFQVRVQGLGLGRREGTIPYVLVTPTLRTWSRPAAQSRGSSPGRQVPAHAGGATARSLDDLLWRSRQVAPTTKSSQNHSAAHSHSAQWQREIEEMDAHARASVGSCVRMAEISLLRRAKRSIHAMPWRGARAWYSLVCQKAIAENVV